MTWYISPYDYRLLRKLSLPDSIEPIEFYSLHYNQFLTENTSLVLFNSQDDITWDFAVILRAPPYNENSVRNHIHQGFSGCLNKHKFRHCSFRSCWWNTESTVGNYTKQMMFENANNAARNCRAAIQSKISLLESALEAMPFLNIN